MRLQHVRTVTWFAHYAAFVCRFPALPRRSATAADCHAGCTRWIACCPLPWTNIPYRLRTPADSHHWLSRVYRSPAPVGLTPSCWTYWLRATPRTRAYTLRYPRVIPCVLHTVQFPSSTVNAAFFRTVNIAVLQRATPYVIHHTRITFFCLLPTSSMYSCSPFCLFIPCILPFTLYILLYFIAGMPLHYFSFIFAHTHLHFATFYIAHFVTHTLCTHCTHCIYIYIYIAYTHFVYLHYSHMIHILLHLYAHCGLRFHSCYLMRSSPAVPSSAGSTATAVRIPQTHQHAHAAFAPFMVLFLPSVYSLYRWFPSSRSPRLALPPCLTAAAVTLPFSGLPGCRTSCPVLLPVALRTAQH